MPQHTIGMWMYHNGGGMTVQHQIATGLRARDIHMINGLDLNQAVAQNGTVMCHGTDMESLDLYFSYNAGQQTPYQVYLYEMLDKSVPCINSFAAFSLTEDKFRTSHLLNRHGIRTADYQLCHYKDHDNIQAVLKSWGGQAVYKPTNGWGGQGIVKIDSPLALECLLSSLYQSDVKHFYLERFVDTDKTDYRIDVVDGKIIGCYGRKAPPNEWKTNITSGGTIMLRECNDELARLALKAAKVTGLDIAGVDLIFDREHQEYVVLEVNGIPAFATPEQEQQGLNFNAMKVERIVNLIENKVKGQVHAPAFTQQVA
jgi:ribosomal protein S6--L-glutamate ligase